MLAAVRCEQTIEQVGDVRRANQLRDAMPSHRATVHHMVSHHTGQFSMFDLAPVRPTISATNSDALSQDEAMASDMEDIAPSPPVAPWPEIAFDRRLMEQSRHA